MNPTLKEYHQKAQSALRQRLFEQAHRYCLLILKNDPRFADAWFLMAMIAADHGRAEKAIGLIEKALVLAGDNAEYLTQLARCKVMINDHVGATVAAERAEQLEPASAFLLDTLGVVYSHIGLHDSAAQLFEKAVLKDKGRSSQMLYNLAIAKRFTGGFGQSQKALQKCLTLKPDAFEAHWALSQLQPGIESDKRIALLEQFKGQVSNSKDALFVGHALSKEYEYIGDYNQSFQSLKWGKEHRLGQSPYDFAGDERTFTKILSLVSSSGFFHSEGFDNDEPIFVVGMPRTGTTLLERVISNHSEVTSCGEMQHFSYLFKKMITNGNSNRLNAQMLDEVDSVDFATLGKDYIQSTRALTGGTRKFVDKMPLNILYAGFILKALPKAKIICIKRNPMDTVFSNYRQLFAANQGYYDYAYDLQSTARYYREFDRLSQCLAAHCGDNFMTVDYEQLVIEPETQAAKILSFCDLSWQKDCLSIESNTSPVPTSSSTQVKRGISKNFVGKWQRYRAFAEPVLEILGQNG